MGVLLLYSSSLPVYLRNFKSISGTSEIIRPVNFLLMTQCVTLTGYLALVGLLNISGRASFYELINQLAEKTKAQDSMRIVKSLKIPQNTLLLDHLAKNNKVVNA
jgi:hypothetical protein